MMFTTKVGAAKRIPRSRIWLEGDRLASAGFTNGARYNAVWSATGATLTLCADGARKVAGTEFRPVIDITGTNVRNLGCARVTVTFCNAVITIKG
jgi:hypothetical protein